MKKFIAILVVAMMLTLMGAAMAEPVSSPVAPAVVVEKIVVVSEDGEEKTLPETFVISFAAEEEVYSEPVTVLHETILAKVEAQESIVEMYTEEEQLALSTLLPEEYDLTKLAVSEFVPMTIEGYEEEIGTFDVTLAVPGEYTEEEVVIAMFGLIAEDGTIAWTPFVVQVVEGKLQVTFDQETMKLIEDKETVLVILREPPVTEEAPVAVEG